MPDSDGDGDDDGDGTCDGEREKPALSVCESEVVTEAVRVSVGE